MKNFYIIIIYVFLVLFISGCGVRNCVKIGGEYEGTSGEIEYCFDKQATAKNSVPTCTGEDGKEYFLLNEEEIKKLSAKVNNKENKENFETLLKSVKVKK